MTAIDFNLMVARHDQFLRPYAQILTADPDAARDLTQETMLRALLNRDKYRLGTNLKAWLYTIMRNTFINDYRRQRRMQRVGQPQVLENIYAEQGRAAQNMGYQSLRYREILTAMDQMPQMFRLPFELHYTGYKYAEIADLLQEPLGTIKSRIHNARKSLAARLER
jgi:RNA polymerase sigma-70 factor (ECF subfamily)